jgi:hypothetical protein
MLTGLDDYWLDIVASGDLAQDLYNKLVSALKMDIVARF